MKQNKGSKSYRNNLRVIAIPAFSNRRGNPYNWLLYTNLNKLGVKVADYSKYNFFGQKWDILHLHWPNNVMSPPRWSRACLKALNLSLILTVARIKDIRIVWTVHNLESHERYHPRLEKLFMQYFTRQVDGYINLSETAEELVRDRYPSLSKTSSIVSPHGHYRDVYPNYVTRKDARKKLNIDPNEAKVLLFFGRIRSYKNINSIMAAFHHITDHDAVLLIAGRPGSPEIEREIIEMAANDMKRIRLHLEFISEKDMQIYFNAADLVILPYAELLNSGSAVLALSYNVPVLVPDKGSFKDLQSLLGKEWVRTYKGKLTPEEVYFHLNYASKNMSSARLPLEQLAWDQIALTTLNFYKSIVFN